MYNGVGLPTPRGSGTSGYVQKNLAYVNKTSSKIQFQKELEILKANPPKPPKKPNKEILQHEQKRLIEIQLIALKKALESEGKDSAEIEEKIRKVRKHLHSKLDEAPLGNQNTSHGKTFQKTEEIQRFQSALNISKDYVPGSGFDFEAIEERRVKELETKKTNEKAKQKKEEAERMAAEIEKKKEDVEEKPKKKEDVGEKLEKAKEIKEYRRRSRSPRDVSRKNPS